MSLRACSEGTYIQTAPGFHLRPDLVNNRSRCAVAFALYERKPQSFEIVVILLIEADEIAHIVTLAAVLTVFNFGFNQSFIGFGRDTFMVAMVKSSNVGMTSVANGTALTTLGVL